MNWKIKDIEIKNQVVLAPMAGISNPSYIKICEEMGLAYAITELISAEAVIRDNKKTFDMLKGLENINIPVAVQLFGADPKSLSLAAKKIVDVYPNVIIDINMGCPVPKVALKSGAGSALLKDVSRIEAIVSAVVNAVSVPVTAKIRSGWDLDSINADLVAKTIEKAGASAISVHARTRSQGYSGSADWNVIKQVKESVNIPVVGNGDIKSCYDAKRMLDETGCDAVMIGRAALGNPWIIKDTILYLDTGIEPKEIDFEEKIDMMIKHINALYNDKNEHVATLELRSILMYYLKGLANTHDLKLKICKCLSKEEYINTIEEYKKMILN